ncbi:MAG: hypothetical protein U0W40_04915 [Acidimicrobiia bacterium]
MNDTVSADATASTSAPSRLGARHHPRAQAARRLGLAQHHDGVQVGQVVGDVDDRVEELESDDHHGDVGVGQQ